MSALVRLPYARMLLLAAAVFLSPVPQPIASHGFSQGHTTLELSPSQTVLTYELDENSVSELTGGDANRDGVMDQREFEAVRIRLESMLNENIVLEIDGKPETWTHVESFVLEPQGDTAKAVWRVVYPGVSASESVSLTDRFFEDGKSGYSNRITVQYGGRLSEAVLTGAARSWSSVPANEADPNSDGVPLFRPNFGLAAVFAGG
ncbi:hypothetical protein [Cohnella caldifontis]|uniref:hypothetical protein n=1 Tax=Cohnella caldifontis TaxID=3027471 RepID=UPI0023ED6AF8|nr:hypothetical protein [Cohnella sp. YIM B05605]